LHSRLAQHLRSSYAKGHPPTPSLPGEHGEILGRLEVGREKVARWSTKTAISLKRVKIEESYYGEPIGSHKRSFEWYYPRPITASTSPRLGAPNSTSKLQLLLSQELLKLRTANLAETFTASIRTQPMKNFGEKGAWAHPGTAHIFLSTPYYLRNG